MEYSPSKRRKTSPNSAIQVTASRPNDLSRYSDGTNITPSRWSYMSPTRASLARFNPTLLPRSGSAEPPRHTKGNAEGGRRAHTEDRVTLAPLTEQHAGETSNTPPRGDVPNGVNHRSPEEPPSSLQNTPSKLPESVVSRKSRRNMALNGKLQTPANEKRRQKTSRQGSEVDQEPSLPSTPSQLGLEAPAERPKGLLFQSPNKRRHRHLDSLLQSSRPERKNRGDRNVATEDRLTIMMGSRRHLDNLPRLSAAESGSRSRIDTRTLVRLERRLELLQHELTKLCIQSADSSDSSRDNKEQKRLRKQISQDARSVSRSSAGDDHEHERSTSALVQRSRLPNLPRTSFSGLARFSPFIRTKSRMTVDRRAEASQDAATGDSDPTFLLVNVESSSMTPRSLGDLAIDQTLGLFTVGNESLLKLHLSIDPVSQHIPSLTLSSIASWVDPDFSVWLQEQTGQSTPQSIGAAIRQYLRVATLRAQCWSHCRAAMRNLVGLEARSEDDDRARETLHLKKATTELLVRWKISLSEGGTAKSDTSIEIKVPQTWTSIDTENDLGHIEHAFDELVRQRGVTDALQTIAGVIFPA